MKKLILLGLLILPFILSGCTYQEDIKRKWNHCNFSYCEEPVQYNVIKRGNTFTILCIDGVEHLKNENTKDVITHFKSDEQGRPYLVKCENK